MPEQTRAEFPAVVRHAGTAGAYSLIPATVCLLRRASNFMRSGAGLFLFSIVSQLLSEEQCKRSIKRVRSLQ